MLRSTLASATAIVVFLTCSSSFAAEGEDLGSAATNPVSDLIQIRLQEQYSPSNYNSGGYSNAALIQTVVPFHLPFEKVPMLVTRMTMPYVSTPDLGDPIGRKHGLGDTALNLFFVPTGIKGGVIGIGPTITIPTAGDNEFTGSGQWQAGPSAVYMNTATPKLQWGGLVFQQWDIGATRSGAADVSQLFIQPLFIKHFDAGWYVSLPDTPQKYDFETEDWTLNLGGVLGRVFKMGKQPLQVYGGVYYNSEDNEDIPSGKWTIKFNVSFLFP